MQGRRMKRLSVQLAILMAVTAMLVACGKKDGAGAEKKEAEKKAVPEAKEAESKNSGN